MNGAGSISSELLMYAVFVLPLMAGCLETIDVCIWRMIAFNVCCGECLSCIGHC